MEQYRSERNAIARMKNLFSFDFDAVGSGAAPTPEIFGPPIVAFLNKPAMTSRYLRMGQYQIYCRIPTNDDGWFIDLQFSRGQPRKNGNLDRQGNTFRVSRSSAT